MVLFASRVSRHMMLATEWHLATLEEMVLRDLNGPTGGGLGNRTPLLMATLQSASIQKERPVTATPYQPPANLATSTLYVVEYYYKVRWGTLRNSCGYSCGITIRFFASNWRPAGSGTCASSSHAAQSGGRPLELSSNPGLRQRGGCPRQDPRTADHPQSVPGPGNLPTGRGSTL